MALKIRRKIDEKKFFQVVLISFLAVQLVSWVISSISDTPLLKGGPMFFLFLFVILVMTLFTIGKNFTTLSMKKDGLFIFLVFAAVLLLFFILPSVVPEIFSTSGMEFKEFLRESVGTIIQLGPSGVAG